MALTRAVPFVIIPAVRPPRRAGPVVREKPISLRVTILASGSSGNATLLETAQTCLLVDAGLSKKETLRRLTAVGRQVSRLDGILISHEHSDHIGGLAQVLGHWRTPVYLTEATHSEVTRILPERSRKRLDRVEHIRAGQRLVIGDIEVSAFSIPHDAADPVGFTF
jgi:phosphoribosyl 1,2-cyclic phosphodiesterase